MPISGRTDHAKYMREALKLARRAYGETSPNPMVGALLVKGGRIIGRGWHHRAGEPHAEIEAIRDAQSRGETPRGATLYVTLEPCSTFGRTPPCTEAIRAARIARVVVGATDPNPLHAGRGLKLLSTFGIKVLPGILRAEASRLNEAFNHWVVNRTPFTTVKMAMTLDGKIATAAGESKWITNSKSRALVMKLRQGADAIMVGSNTVLRDNPRLTARKGLRSVKKCPLRVIVDSRARTPLTAKILSDEFKGRTLVVVTRKAPLARVRRISKQARVLVAPEKNGAIDLAWLLRKLGAEEITNLLVEGGGELNASFLLAHLAQRVAFFYAPKVLGGREAIKAVAGKGVERAAEVIQLEEVEFRRLGDDVLLNGRIAAARAY